MNVLDMSEESEAASEKDNDPLLPPRPKEPLASSCCGLGCTPCVYDLYDQELILWQAECEKIKLGKTSENSENNSQVVLSPDEYKKFELLDKSQETADSYRYTFLIPGYQQLPLNVGQHLILRWKTADKVVTRQYTPITKQQNKGKMEFVIKIYPDGEMSQYIKMWKPGDLIEWRGPFGNFTFKENMYKHIVMLAAGTGITPMIQLIQHVLYNEEDETWLHLVYACKRYSDILCKNLLDEWSDYWNFSAVYIISEEKDGCSELHRYGDKIVYGKLTEDLVRHYIMDYMDSVRVLVCGTKSFDKDMLKYLSNMNISVENIYKF